LNTTQSREQSGLLARMREQAEISFEIRQIIEDYQVEGDPLNVDKLKRLNGRVQELVVDDDQGVLTLSTKLGEALDTDFEM